MQTSGVGAGVPMSLCQPQLLSSAPILTAQPVTMVTAAPATIPQTEMVTITGPMHYGGSGHMIANAEVTTSAATMTSETHSHEDHEEGEEEEEEEEEEDLTQDARHQCKECDKFFPTKREFLHHTYIHKENPKYICPICSKIFPSEPGFKRHVRAHQNRLRRNIPCGICSMVFSHRSELEEHHRENHLYQKLFRCQVCGAEFSWHDNLKKHMRMHNVKPDNQGAASTQVAKDNSSNNADYVCNVCKATFMDNTSLRIHSRSHNQQQTKPKKQYICKVCSKEFKFDFSYEAHMNAHEKTNLLAAATSKQKEDDVSKPGGPIQLVTEYGEAAATPHDTNNKVITEIQLPPVPPISKDDPQGPTEMMVQISPQGLAGSVTFSKPPYGVTYTPPESNSNAKKESVKDWKGETEFMMIDDRRFVKSPFKGGRRALRVVKPEAPKKRMVNPVLYDLAMTDKRPFRCNYCDASFRWEVSLTIHEREHDPNYRPPEKTARGRPRSLDPGKDYHYRIVRRRDSDDDEEEDEEFEDIKGGDQPRPKRRYRKKKDLEKLQTAFQNREIQPTTVVKLTRTGESHVPSIIPAPISHPVVSTIQTLNPQSVNTRHTVTLPQSITPQTVAAQSITPQTVAAAQSITPQTVAAQSVTPQTVAAAQSITPQTVAAAQSITPQTVAAQSVTPQTVAAAQSITPQTVAAQSITPQSITPQSIVTQSLTPQSHTPQNVITPLTISQQPPHLNGLVAVLPQQTDGQGATEPVYAVNHQGVHFQVVTDS